LAQVLEREHEVLIAVGGDAGPASAGGRSAALLEFELCSPAAPEHLHNYCTSGIWEGFSNTFVVAAVILVLVFYC